MSDSDSPDHFFSALELLSTVASSQDQDNHRPPDYADDSILMCSLPETPSSSSSTSTSTTFSFLPPAVSPVIGQTIDPLSGSDVRSESVNKTKSSVTRGLTGEKIGSQSSDDGKQDGVAGKECGEDENINPSSAPGTDGESGDGKNLDGSGECTVDVEKLEFLDLLKLLSKPQKERFGDSDILEIAAMKGIYFPPPRWWSVEGYDAKIKDIEMDGGTTKC